jgi:dehydrogenase/reductase SDR family member 12
MCTRYRTGYLQHVKAYTDPVQSAAAMGIQAPGADGVDLTSRVVVVTGANSGIGNQIATYAAAKGAHVYLVCRNAERATTARDAMHQATGNANIHVIVADVGELAAVRQAAAQIQAQTQQVDVLVCNAGVLLDTPNYTSEGHEVTFATHLLGGSYLLSQLLVPQLQAAGEQARVIYVSSGGMYNFPLPAWNVLTSTHPEIPYDGVKVYAYAKRGQVLLAERQSHTMPEITWITAHPGWTDTPAVDDAFGDMKSWLQPLRTPWQGAEGMCWLMGVDKSQLENGALYLDRKVQPKHLSGPFFSEGRFTKNKPSEVDDMMQRLQQAAGL